jgi:hypothetical protein
MRRVYATTIALVISALSLAGVSAQMGDAARKVPGGGIFGAGWKGKIDANEAKAGSTINDSKFEVKGNEISISTGPAGIYWNPADKATGDYTVSATFTEPQHMSASGHPHPYGVFMGGNNLETDNASLLYCAAYGNGNYIVRGFGPAPFAPGAGRKPVPSEAVKKAEKGQPVTQEISMSLKGSQVTCTINGTTVATLTKDDLIGAGKLENIQGIAGIRVTHNIDVKVTNFKVTK